MLTLTVALITSLGLSTIATTTLPHDGGCTAVEQATTGCATNNDNEVIIDGTRPGSDSPNPTPIDNWEPTPNTPGVTPPPEFDFADCLDDWDSYIHCFRPPEDADEETEEDTVEIPAVTISDVARFAPDGSVLAGEPDNVGVAGLPTNFVATASVHTVNGELFGFPVAVRFTPAAFDFAFGDDAAATTTSGGQSWDDLGQAQFTPTPTSHTYSDRGTYSANVDVRYTAEVDFGIGWFPIPGEVTASGPMQEIRIFEAHTALVAHTCQQAPHSPGC